MASDSDGHLGPIFKLNSIEALHAAKRFQIDLAADPVWRVALTGATAAEARPVLRLDRNDDIYYIVDFVKDSRISARMGVRGPSPALLRVNGIRTSNSQIKPFVTVAGFLHGREGYPWGRGEARDRIVRPELVSVHPSLAWKPCAESRSALLPFYLLTVADVVYYLRVDGELFTALTKSQPGR